MNRPKLPLPVSSPDSAFRLWKGLYYSWDEFYDSHTEKINQLICAGIPSKLRGRIWTKLLQIEPLILKNPMLYKFCSSKVSEEDYSIQKDIGRTFPGHPEFKTPKSPGQKNLFSVLKAHANYNDKKEVTYCQGLNFIAGVLVLNMNEEEAFWSLLQLMKLYDFEYIYGTGLPGLLYYSSIFDELIPKHLPNVSEYFNEAGVTANMFVSKWILTLFACMLPLPVVVRIWDNFMCYGWESVIRIGLAILAHSEIHLVDTPMDEIFVYFDNMPEDVLEPNRLFRTASAFVFDEACVNKIKRKS